MDILSVLERTVRAWADKLEEVLNIRLEYIIIFPDPEDRKFFFG